MTQDGKGTTPDGEMQDCESGHGDSGNGELGNGKSGPSPLLAPMDNQREACTRREVVWSGTDSPFPKITHTMASRCPRRIFATAPSSFNRHTLCFISPHIGRVREGRETKREKQRERDREAELVS